MIPREGYIAIRSERLHFVSAGSGSKVLLAFHGYGNDAAMLLPLARYIGDEFTLICVNLPHHGSSYWSANAYLEPSDLYLILKHVKELTGVSQFSLLGYSMGGRVCLKMAELYPESIDKVVLLASDGLSFNTFYYFLTRTTPGKYLFNSFLNRPKHYMHLIELARRRNWIDASRYKFAMQYLKEEADRQFLLRVWPSMAYLIPDYKKLKKAVEQYGIELHLFMGIYDKVIPVSMGKQFVENHSIGKLHIVEKGHRVLDEETMPQIAKCLKGA
ncbi:MAG: hypothetical protein BGO70_17995 [Bacteroidetes bacterium 43-93]|nr:alpha/beta hydrolase [Bacteroidota bacterium]OJX01631.1 MAG: hypothetical protein BGO70_17995 [Bacteroidetes bacterium 43-93]